MKRFFFILLLIIVAATLLWRWIQSKQSILSQDESKEPITVEMLESKLIEVDKELQDTNDILIDCSAERDVFKSKLNQLIRCVKGKTVEEIKVELVKDNSEFSAELWFQEIKGFWEDLKSLERDVIVFTRKEDHLQKRKLQLEQILERKRRDERSKDARKKDFSYLDEIVATDDVMKDAQKKDFTSAEETEINLAINSNMEKIGSSDSEIQGLELTIDELPALPVLTKNLEKPEKTAQLSLLNRVKNDINNIIKETKECARQCLTEKRQEDACYCWFEAIDRLTGVVNSANSSGIDQDFFQEYLDKLDVCKRDVMRIVTKPYRKALTQNVKDLGKEKDPDWSTIIESLEGFYRIVNQIKVKLSSAETKTLGELLDAVDMHLDYLIMQNDLNSKIMSKRLNMILDKIDNEYFTDRFIARHYKKSVQLFEQKKYQKALAEIELCIAKNWMNSDYIKQKRLIEGNLYKPGDRVVYTINDVEFAFRWCPSGTFNMGSPSGEDRRKNDEIQHVVTISYGYWLLETEITQKQWKAIMGNNNPSYFKGDDLPVEQVSWNDCQDFCRGCMRLGLPVQLPTEAQWEFACRAGNTGAYSDDLNETGWYIFNSANLLIFFPRTHPAGTKKANCWGLFDMHGNVWEYCWDWYGDYPNEDATDPGGLSSGSYRVVRGGSYNEGEDDCRSANRGYRQPGYRNYNLGFRVVKCL